MPEKKYKFITIKQAEQFASENKVILATSSGRPVYHITNNKSGGFLGWILWYPAWKQFVFTAVSNNVVFNNSCLRDVLDFLENHTGKEAEKEWKRDDRALRDILLVGGIENIPLKDIKAWDNLTAQAVEEYVGKVILSASDNPVHIPPMPEVLAKYGCYPVISGRKKR